MSSQQHPNVPKGTNDQSKSQTDELKNASEKELGGPESWNAIPEIVRLVPSRSRAIVAVTLGALIVLGCMYLRAPRPEIPVFAATIAVLAMTADWIVRRK